SADPNFLRF
uniref:FMRFamide-like neuropeptide PF2 n=1 Tax=Panagrellus redivivus TaxID=6233 RepID=FAR2_PANRE|nr:RecName: Full=FMRFamide-like neuropeptide PF2; AltName: Full=SADPNFLRF-amide [Panagrellus redivivus]